MMLLRITSFSLPASKDRLVLILNPSLVLANIGFVSLKLHPLNV